MGELGIFFLVVCGYAWNFSQWLAGVGLYVLFLSKSCSCYFRYYVVVSVVDHIGNEFHIFASSVPETAINPIRTSILVTMWTLNTTLGKKWLVIQKILFIVTVREFRRSLAWPGHMPLPMSGTFHEDSSVFHTSVLSRDRLQDRDSRKTLNHIQWRHLYVTTFLWTLDQEKHLSVKNI